MAVIERQERRVEALHLVVHRLNIWADTSLVAKTPKYDTRMIFVSFNKRSCPIDMSLLPFRIFTHLLVGIAIAVALLICLVHDIHAITVA